MSDTINLTTSWVSAHVKSVLGKRLIRDILKATGWGDLDDVQMGTIKNRLHTLKEFEVWEEVMEVVEEYNAEIHDILQHFVTVKDVAALKGCHVETVRRALRDGDFPGAQAIGVGTGRRWLLPDDEVTAWQPANTKPGRKTAASVSE